MAEVGTPTAHMHKVMEAECPIKRVDKNREVCGLPVVYQALSHCKTCNRRWHVACCEQCGARLRLIRAECPVCETRTVELDILATLGCSE